MQRHGIHFGQAATYFAVSQYIRIMERTRRPTVEAIVTFGSVMLISNFMMKLM